jgi:hypothetical protein
MIPEAAWALVPESRPSDIESWETIAVVQTGLDRRQERAYLWAHAILRSARASGILPSLESYWNASGARVADISAGFIPFGKIEDINLSGQRQSLYHQLSKATAHLPDKIWAQEGSDRWAFGLVIGLEFPDGGPSGEARPFALPVLGPVVPVGGRPFLVIVEWREVVLDKPSNPSGAATSACYVRARSGKRYYSGTKYTDGILVARHVLVPSYTTAGASVPMATTPSSTATVADIDSATTIDAAVLDDGNSMPSGAKLVSLVAAVAPGLHVTVDGSVTKFTADVLRVMDDPNYFGNMAAHRAFIDNHGKKGDSGALTSDTSGDAVGLYIGSTKAPIEGIVQLMRQVTTYFEIDLYI